MITVSSSFNFIFKLGILFMTCFTISLTLDTKSVRKNGGRCTAGEENGVLLVDVISENKCIYWTWSINWNSTQSVWYSANVRKQSKILALCELLGMVWLFCYCYLMFSFSGHASFYFSFEELISYRDMPSYNKNFLLLSRLLFYLCVVNAALFDEN